MKRLQTEVLVIGGGPVGLSTALLLADQGVDCILVEKHETTASHPKASYFNVRTMEILRQLGVADDVYATALMPQGVLFYTRLTGHCLGGYNFTDFPEYTARVLASTGSPACVSSQIVLEDILKQHADANAGIRVLFGHEKTSIEQDGARVLTSVLDRAAGETYEIESRFAVACEGIRSSTRDACGRKMVGPPPFGHVMNIYVEADLEGLTGERNQALFWICNPDTPGAFIGLGGDRLKWCFNTPYFPEDGESAEDFDEKRCLERIYAALGTDSLPVKILAVGPWVLCGQVVDQYRQGNIFFGGDTAHSNIPTGGFGFNTGMQETHNLAWKLAAFLKGDAPEAILDTYHSERRGIAVFNVEKSRENAINIRDTGATFGGRPDDTDEIDLDTDRGRAQRAAKTRAIAEQKTHFLFLGQEIGFGYWDSPLIVPDGTDHYAVANDVDDPVHVYIPNARPGARAPHCWVALRDVPDKPIPMHDVFGKGFVLLTRGEGDEWSRSIDSGSAAVPLRSLSVGPVGSDSDLLDAEGRWDEVYGLDGQGAVLVRPDGHVCWRAFSGPSHHDGVTLRDALGVAVGGAISSPAR